MPGGAGAAVNVKVGFQASLIEGESPWGIRHRKHGIRRAVGVFAHCPLSYGTFKVVGWSWLRLFATFDQFYCDGLIISASGVALQ